MNKMLLLFAAIACVAIPNVVLGQSGVAHFGAQLTGGQENPAVTTAATGTGTFSLTDAGLAYAITFEGITLTASHFHLGATGVNGGVVRAIDFAGANTVSGVWASGDSQPLTDGLVAELIAGNIYVNLHTSANPGGEIRGQVTLSGGIGLSANLTGAQENPAVTTAATGTGTFSLTDAGLAYTITFEGITLTASHFHLGAIGVNGGVVRAIDFAGANTVSGVWASGDSQPLTDSLVAELIAGNIYVNLHTAAYGGGEIRGQLLPGIIEVPIINAPKISNIEDVPDDQGGWIYLRWLASEQDALGNITQYGISELNLANEWVSLGSVPSTQFGEYIFPAHTFQDSSDQGIYWSKFQVSAHTIDPEVFFSSEIDSGFSVDNLSPAVPSGLLALITEQDAVQLTWDAPVDADFEYFRIYRSNESGFDPSGIEPYSESIGTLFIDTEVSIDQIYYYILSAVDSHGNESGFSEEVSATIVGIEGGEIIPSDYVLYDAYPNPFNPSTTIKYGLPYQSDATLIIYNLMGQEIVRWDEYNLTAGYYEKTWNGTNKFGVPVVSGVYLYKFITGDFVVTRKMLLLK
ncbi:MAG: CHRD domain-containing protein [Candidatus Marinimicrobia bacterium]|nr:CHRD domain-containing protein [Candidatus Neomarinimicrobiota bacterium]